MFVIKNKVVRLAEIRLPFIYSSRALYFVRIGDRIGSMSVLSFERLIGPPLSIIQLLNDTIIMYMFQDFQDNWDIPRFVPPHPLSRGTFNIAVSAN